MASVVGWLPTVHRWHAEYPDLDPAWILAIIAQESMGFPDVVGSDRVGSVGLMQIAPFSWRPSVSQLKNPSINIQWGMGILDTVQGQTEGDIRRSLALYNCGETGLNAGLCGRHGGWAYSDRLLDYWVPVFRAELTVRAGEHDLIGTWLAELGYRYGMGRWEVMSETEVMPEEKEEVCLPARRFRSRICR
ncbi:hypothetical protein LCGC14_2376170 [marine sediment metagenome]|uniref:Transglycosylase SLT domain-containing protein n=1 Tax=marine sediment metagenome TaxID=412755 RepID=A0A0F9EER7_9ZZZZ